MHAARKSGKVTCHRTLRLGRVFGLQTTVAVRHGMVLRRIMARVEETAVSVCTFRDGRATTISAID